MQNRSDEGNPAPARRPPQDDRLIRLERDIAVAVSGTGNLAEALEHILAGAVQLSDIDCGGIYLVDEATGAVDLASHKGLSEEFIAAVSHLGPDTRQVQLLRRGQPAYFGQEELHREDDDCRREGLRSLAMIPVKHEGRIIAALNLASRSRSEILAESRTSLETIAVHLGGAIARLRAEEALRAARADLERRVNDRTAELAAANAQLREEAERRRILSLAVEQATEGIAIAAIDGTVRFANDAFARMHGYAAEEVIGKHLSVFHRPEQMPDVERIHAQILATGTFSGEVWHARRDGTAFPTLMRNAMLRDEGGQAIGVIATAVDITEQKRAEEALRESEQRYRQLADHLEDVFWLTDASANRALYVSPAYERIWGRSCASLLEDITSWVESIHPEDRAAAVSAIFSRAPAEPIDIEYRIIRPDGGVRWIRDRSVPIRDDAGVTFRIAGIATDITADKQLQADLAASQRTLSTLMSNLPGMVYRCRNDAAWTMEFVSEGCFDLTGYHPDDLIGNREISYAEVIHPDDRLAVADAVAAAVRAREAFRLEYRIITALGEVKWVWEQGRAVYGREGDVLALEGLIVDITDRKRAEEELEASRESERRLRHLLAQLLHVGNALSQCESLTDLCRQAVELGRSRLGYDRLGLWWLTNEPGVLRGSFGTDEAGAVRDERDRTITVSESTRELLARQEPGVVLQSEDRAITDDHGRPVGQGTLLRTIIWDGRQVRGVLFADNLLRGEPFTSTHRELLALFASTIGHLAARRAAEDALRESEERYRTLAECAQDLIFIIGRDDRVEYVNRFAAERIGRTPEDLIGQPRATLFPPSVSEGQARDLQEVFDTGRAVSRESMIPTPGGPLWINTQLVPLRRSPGDEVVAVLGISRDITASKEAEEALRESEARFRMVTENSLTGVYVFGEDRLLYVNPAFAAVFGYACDEIVGRMNPLELIHPEDRARAAENIRRRLTGEVAAVQYELRGLRKDGTVIHVEVLGRRVDYKGAPAIIGTLIDVTEKKKAQEALQESEARFRMVTESTLAGVYVVQDGRFRYVNPALAAAFGYTADEIIDRLGPIDLTHPDDRPLVAEQIRRRLDNEVETARYSVRGLRKDGSVIHIDILGRRIEYLGRPAIIGTILDMSDRVRAEEELRESEMRHRTILDEMQEAVIFADAEDRICHINACACALMGAPREALLGRMLLDVHSEALRPRIAEMLQAFRRQRPTETITIRRPFRDRELIFRFSPVYSPEGVYRGVIANIIDITDQVRLQQQLAEARRMEAIGTLAGGVAHDFNNLMATVLGCASYLKGRRRPDHPDYEFLARIENAADTAGRLAHQLLLYAKGGKIRPRLVRFNEVVDRAVEAFRPLVPRNVRFEQQVASDLGHVECDTTQIEQVIANLCRNAVDAMENGGRLTVRAMKVTLNAPMADSHPPLPAGDYVCVEVEDTGSGMDAETAQRVFEPFFTTKATGYGLGLAAAWGTLKSHGGAIAVTTEPGKGSTFRFWLPRARIGG